MNKLSAAPLASKGSARASPVDAATAKAELGVNGCLCLGSTIELPKHVISSSFILNTCLRQVDIRPQPKHKIIISKSFFIFE
ncbi:hypothetical protein FYC62_04535 [Pedobacter aquae]|uniref:Uncharacterized protein n=1 Tax=Pedobacter aquae TaxID=2605747 RepID=A0A5C0VIJ6_9SPHI|nr:hypothetical protein [Pedobacter aquae]QEK51020.1 hypothetical protein FYC62_04535 [Pedobacter aquae]